MARPRARVALLAALWLAAAAASARPEEDAGGDLAIPVGFPVQLDGGVNAAEWEGAALLPLGTDGTTLRLAQHRGTLLLAVDAPRPWARGGHLVVHVSPDRDGPAAGVPGAVRIDYEPREHNRPHLLVTRRGEAGEEMVAREAVARARTEGPRAGVEVAIRLSLLGPTAADAGPRRAAVLWTKEPGEPAETWPAGLDLGGRPGQVPADLRSTRRWGRWLGWVDPEGPGALSRTEWDRLAGEDAESARRGEKAHGVALLLQEDPLRPKRDREVVPDLVDNLAWIAEREPLTGNDLLALAIGLRSLNRAEEALGVLAGMAADPAWRDGDLLLYHRALALDSLERFGESAAVWTRMAERAAAGHGARYEAAAARARESAKAFEAEEKARAEDAARTDLPTVRLRTERGDVLVQLFSSDVARSVEHFLALVERTAGGGGRTYDGAVFDRVVGNFAAQVSGRGEPPVLEAETNARHGFWRGAVGFARGQAPENRADLFILTSPRPELGTKGYTCFGRVLAGMDAVDRIEEGDRLLEVRVLSR